MFHGFLYFADGLIPSSRDLEPVIIHHDTNRFLQAAFRFVRGSTHEMVSLLLIKLMMPFGEIRRYMRKCPQALPGEFWIGLAERGERREKEPQFELNQFGFQANNTSACETKDSVRLGHALPGAR
jgi:hypothetical protein